MTTAVQDPPKAPTAPVVPATPVAPTQQTIPAVVAPVTPTPVAASESTKAVQPEASKALLADTPAPAAEQAKAAAPETPAEPDYAALKMPEKSALEAEHLAAVQAFAKENKLSVEAAQKIIERDSQLASKVGEKYAATQKAEYDGLWSKYETEIKSDKEFGGEKLPQTLNAAKAVLKKYATAEERAAIESTPMGSNPVFIRLLARMGAGLSEDGAPGLSKSGGDVSAAHPSRQFYPSMYNSDGSPKRA